MSDEITEARGWFAFALGDLEAARSGRRGRLRPRIVAFHAQQAAEKAIKAALILDDLAPPPKHDLEELRRLLPDVWQVKRRPTSLDRLTDYGVDAKYPDHIISVTPLDAATAVRQAMAVIRLVSEEFERRGVRVDDLKLQ